MALVSSVYQSRADYYECLSCHQLLQVRKFPRGNAFKCRKCVGRATKLKNKTAKNQSFITPTKAKWAARLRHNMTPAENHLWAKLSHLAPIFTPQTVLYGFIADFACINRRIIIELDGPIHDERKEYDGKRDLAFKAHSYRTLRFTNDRVLTDRKNVLGEIMEAL